jgi:hypothetical protein
METTRINDPYRNPFHNRFHVPVHSRLDEMQAFTHMAWLNESAAQSQDAKKNQHERPWRTALAATFALVLVLVVVFSVTLLWN